MGELEGKVVAITGAARGMGRAFTQAYLDAGAKVVAMDLSWEPSGFSTDDDESYVKDLQSNNNAIVCTTDVSNDADLDAAFDATMTKWGTCDVLINDAAMRSRNLFPPTGRRLTLDTSDEDWTKMFAVNVFGALKVTRRFVKPMIEKKSGSIMSVISSGALHSSFGGAQMAFRPSSVEMPYQSTKAALLTMMFYLADEIKKDNVAVNLMVPGHTRTTGFDEQNIARREQGMGSSRAPLPLTPQHIVPLALFLGGRDAASGVTGKCFDATTWNIEHGIGTQAQFEDVAGTAVSENPALSGR
jgi:NAD(P)-dependent dehydrogenase (short-subunit alcohol dehydrogenase family)